MQYAVFPMPPNPIATIDRRVSVTTERFLWQIEPSVFNYHDQNHQDIRLGTACGDLPKHTYKAIYISGDGRWIFEVVYTQERGLERCIYVKMIGEDITFGIPLDTILHYSQSPGTLVSIGSILNETNWMRDCQLSSHDIQTIIPPVYGREAIDREIIGLLAHGENNATNNAVAETWAPLYYHEPNVLGALMTGSFIKAPHHEIQGVCSFLHPLPRRYDDAYNLSYRAKALGGRIYCDQHEFDPIILSLLQFPIPEFSISVSFTDGLEGIVDTGVTKYYHDPYQMLRSGSNQSSELMSKMLGGLIQEVLWAYSQVFDCDLYDNTRRMDKSYLTVSKNMFDEIILEFHDRVENNHVGIYGNMVSLALATQGVGYKLRAM